MYRRGGGRGRGRGQGGGGRGKKLGVLTLSLPTYNPTQSDSSSTYQEDVSSLSDLSSSALEKINLSNESTFMKRLFKEYVMIRKSPMPNVSVSPLPQDFTEWHGNIRGPEGTPYEGGIFHFTIEFKPDHPRSPPNVTMLTRIEHPCVQHGRIDLDFLTKIEQSKRGAQGPSRNTERYRTWSPAYTVMSVLIQLQAFLYEGTAEIALEHLTDLTEYTERRKKWESGVRFSVDQSLRFSCSSCKHRPRKYWPPIPESPTPPTVSEEALYLENAVCFFTQKTHEEAAVGVGIHYAKDLRTGHIQSVHCVPDIISLNAFKGSKVTEAWGQHFTHWMPIYLRHSHPERSIHLAQRSLSSMYAGNPGEFQPSMVLDFVPRLLSNLAVSFVSTEEGGDALRMLHAYCYMHRLFLEFLIQHPTLVSSAKESVRNFIEDPAKRHIDHTASIGLLVIFITFTGQTWDDLAPSYLAEGFDRNVRRIVRRYPELNTSEPDPKIDATRISKSFAALNLSGLRFLMTQLLFNRLFVAPHGSTLEYVAAQYDKYSSLVPKRLEDQLLEEKAAIVAVNSFSAFYERIGRTPPADEELLAMLREAVARSQEKHYHGDKGIEVLSPEEFEKQRLGSIRPLEEMVATSGEGAAPCLHDNEDQWRALCETRFGLMEIPPSYATVSLPWKHLYLQHNLQELVGKLNDNPDFKLLYGTLDLSKDTLTHFDLVTFNPDNIKSHYFFLSRILELLPKLTHLTISKGEISLGEKGFKELVKGMTKSSGALQVLDMRYLGITEAHVSKLAESHLTSEGLTCLNLEGNSLGTEGTTKLARLMLKHRSLPNLAELNLRACKITDAGMKALAEGLLVKRNITKLDLSKNSCGAAGLAEVLKSLSYSPSLKELMLTGLSIHGSVTSGSLPACLGKMFELSVTLEKVSFWNTPLARAFDTTNMKHLAENGVITKLDLGSTSLNVHDNASFGTVVASSKSVLSDLDLEKNQMNVDGCMKINEYAKGKTSPVTTLNISANEQLFTASGKVREKRFKIMVTFFSQTFANVTHLDVSRCNLDSSAAEVFGEVLSRKTALKHLDMAFNAIGKHGARFLAAGLASNTQLEVLRLDKNSLGAAGAHYLSSVLEKPSCLLKELHLFCNYIDVPGTIAICKALQTNRQLRYIDLGLNRVRKRGAAAVIEMLGVNQTLETLAVKFNFIPDPWAIKIVKQVVEVPHCKVSSLRLAGNSLQYETLVTIVTMLKECSRKVTFDLAARAEYRDPERMERTVYVSPLAANITPDMVKKMFYSKKCGAIKSVTIEKHRKKKTAFAKAKYALVEFAHKDSVELAVDLARKHEAHIGMGYQPTISRAGLGSKAAAEAAAKSVMESSFAVWTH